MVRNGTFDWYDIMSRDVDVTTRFYTQLFGWTCKAVDMGPMGTYPMLHNGEQAFGGITRLREGEATSHWLGYLSTTDLDAAVGRTRQHGGLIRVPPTPIPGVGRFSVITDPGGAVVSLFQGNDPPTGPTARHTEVGDVGWAELMSAELPRARAFYTEVVGWDVSASIDMGEVGLYVLVKVGEEGVGGMVAKPPTLPASNWSFYVNVESADAVVEKAKSLGATVLVGPEDVPDMVRFALLTDPTGALFGVAQPLRK